MIYWNNSPTITTAVTTNGTIVSQQKRTGCRFSPHHRVTPSLYQAGGISIMTFDRIPVHRTKCPHLEFLKLIFVICSNSTSRTTRITPPKQEWNIMCLIVIIIIIIIIDRAVVGSNGSKWVICWVPLVSYI